MSIATSLKSASVRPASTKLASTPAAKQAASTACLPPGVKSTPSQRSACAWIGSWWRAAASGDDARRGWSIRALEDQFLGHGYASTIV
jgi:hypothetical protein